MDNVEFKEFTTILGGGDGFEAIADRGFEWVQQCFLNGCVDMLRLGKEDNLCVIWVAQDGVSMARILDAKKSLRKVLLLRENVDLGIHSWSYRLRWGVA